MNKDACVSVTHARKWPVYFCSQLAAENAMLLQPAKTHRRDLSFAALNPNRPSEIIRGRCLLPFPPPVPLTETCWPTKSRQSLRILLSTPKYPCFM